MVLLLDIDGTLFIVTFLNTNLAEEFICNILEKLYLTVLFTDTFRYEGIVEYVYGTPSIVAITVDEGTWESNDGNEK